MGASVASGVAIVNGERHLPRNSIRRCKRFFLPVWNKCIHLRIYFLGPCARGMGRRRTMINHVRDELRADVPPQWRAAACADNRRCDPPVWGAIKRQPPKRQRAAANLLYTSVYKLNRPQRGRVSGAVNLPVSASRLGCSCGMAQRRKRLHWLGQWMSHTLQSSKSAPRAKRPAQGCLLKDFFFVSLTDTWTSGYVRFSGGFKTPKRLLFPRARVFIDRPIAAGTIKSSGLSGGNSGAAWTCTPPGSRDVHPAGTEEEIA